jgi:hypothetical protein
MRKSAVRHFLAGSLLALIFFGCATLQPGDIPDESLWEKPDPLVMEMAVDVIQLRLDLLREKSAARTSTIVTTDGSYKQPGDFVPHHYLGIYVGGGLFLDINGSVGVDIIRLLGFDGAYAFKLHRTTKGALDAPGEVRREGKTITVNEGGWASDDIVIQTTDEGFTMKTSRFFDPDKIVFDENKIEYIPSGLFSNFRGSSIEQDGDITRGSTNYRVERIDENRLNLNGSYEIIREENKIILKGRGDPLAIIVKSGDRYVFFRSESYGSWVEKLGDNKIRISDNGVITEYTYEVETRPVKQPSKPPEAPESRVEDQPTSRAKTGREKIEKRMDRKTRREASSPPPPN